MGRADGPRPGRAGADRRFRVLVYSHDTYGLGHLRRSVALAERLARSPRVGPVLVATGSPRPQAFPLPPGCDTLKLPAVTKRPDGRYAARSLPLSLPEVARLRSGLLLAAAEGFAPDLVLVDHAPVGMDGELWPLLDRLRLRPGRPALVLGLRDVIDEPRRVDREWQRLGAWEAIGSLYDRVLVYGDPAVGTTAQDLGLAERFPGKVRLVGYLGRAPRPAPSGGDRPTVLVAAGGGGDGHALLRSYAAFLEGLEGPAPFRSVVVTGPFLSARRRRELVGRYRRLPHPVDVLEFTERFEDLLAGAAGVVCMAGYNTVVEVLASGVPALLVPRRSPRVEQWIRAERLAPVAPLELCSPDQLPARLARFVPRVLKEPGAGRGVPPVRLDGLERAAREVLALLRARDRQQLEGRGVVALPA